MCLSMMDQPFQLAHVPIGEPHPPRQTYCLRNGGPAELQYSINTAPLQQLVTSSYGYEVSRCVAIVMLLPCTSSPALGFGERQV